MTATITLYGPYNGSNRATIKTDMGALNAVVATSNISYCEIEGQAYFLVVNGS